MGALIVIGIAGFVLIGFIAYGVTIYNSLIAVKNNISKAWGNIDVLLKQRHDEIPKLIKACEAYMKYEKETLSKIVELRSSAQSAQTVTKKALVETELTGALHRLFALAENYPDLKSQPSFQQLQNRISAIENQIADRREFYNDSVNNYNIRIQSVPDNILAGFMRLYPHEMFKASEEERQDVEIKINVP